MAKAEIRVLKIDVFDSKLEGKVKTIARTSGEGAAKVDLPKAYVIDLEPTVEWDGDASEVVARCGWRIYEEGGKKLLPQFKQTKGSSARATAKRDKVGDRELNQTIGAVAEIEVAAIVKVLKALK